MIYCDLILLYQQTRRLRMSGPVSPFLLYVFMGCAGGRLKGTDLCVTSRKTKICPNNGHPYAWQPVEMQPARNETRKRIFDSFTYTNVLYAVRYSIIRLVYVMETVAIYCLEETEFSCKLYEIRDSDGQRWIDALRSVLCMLKKSNEV